MPIDQTLPCSALYGDGDILIRIRVSKCVKLAGLPEGALYYELKALQLHCTTVHPCRMLHTGVATLHRLTVASYPREFFVFADSTVAVFLLDWGCRRHQTKEVACECMELQLTIEV